MALGGSLETSFAAPAHRQRLYLTFAKEKNSGLSFRCNKNLNDELYFCGIKLNYSYVKRRSRFIEILGEYYFTCKENKCYAAFATSFFLYINKFTKLVSL